MIKTFTHVSRVVTSIATKQGKALKTMLRYLFPIVEERLRQREKGILPSERPVSGLSKHYTKKDMDDSNLILARLSSMDYRFVAYERKMGCKKGRPRNAGVVVWICASTFNGEWVTYPYNNKMANLSFPF
jgi:hypothetical protein